MSTFLFLFFIMSIFKLAEVIPGMGSIGGMIPVPNEQIDNNQKPINKSTLPEYPRHIQPVHKSKTQIRSVLTKNKNQIPANGIRPSQITNKLYKKVSYKSRENGGN